MSEYKLSIEEIKDLMDKMKETNLGEISVSDGEFILRLRSKENAGTAVVNSSATQAIAMQESAMQEIATQAIAPQNIATSQEPVKVEGNVVTAPIVGTFYASAAPDKPAFVTVGSAVKKGDVLFVIESMKLMNEIQSDFDGVVTAINVSNAQAVEYGQNVMIIK